MPSTFSSPPPAAPRTRQRLKDERPQQLVDAALALFVERGFAATRIEQVVQLAGVSKGTLYLYFPSKEELFKAVVRNKLGSLIDEGTETIDAFDGHTAELLRTLYATWWSRVGNTEIGGLQKVVLAELRHFPELAQFYVDEVAEPARRLVQRVVERGIARGEFAPLDAETAAHALMSPMIHVLLHRHSIDCCPTEGPALDAERLLDAHAELMLRGLLRRAGDPS